MTTENNLQRLQPERKKVMDKYQVETGSVIETVNITDREYIENRVDTEINNYSIEYGIDIENTRQLKWNNVLDYINRHLFRNKDKSIIDYKDILLLNMLADIYIQTCYKYNKSTSLYGYSIFIGINYNTIYAWNNNRSRNLMYIDIDSNTVIDNDIVGAYKIKYPNRNIVEIPNNEYTQLTKKIADSRQHALTDQVENGSVMSLALGKIEYGWIEGKDKQLQAAALETALTGQNLLADYKQLYLNDGQNDQA